ncbi:hypothetical protein ACVWYV_003969 [Pantoea eucalypti]
MTIPSTAFFDWLQVIPHQPIAFAVGVLFAFDDVGAGVTIADSPHACHILVRFVHPALYPILSAEEYRSDSHSSATRDSNKLIAQAV